MSTLAADVSFDFTFPPCEPSTPPSFTFDPSLLGLPFQPQLSSTVDAAGGHHTHHHSRTSSHGSVYSFESSPSDSANTGSTPMTTPSRSPIRTHGPLLLPKIRSQDQAFGTSAAASSTASPPKRMKTSPAPASHSNFRRSHARSYTNPEAISWASALSFGPQFGDESISDTSLLCSPVSFVPQNQEPADAGHPRRASSCSLDNATIEKYGFPTYRQMPTYVTASGPNSRASTPQAEPYMYQQPYAPRAPSPLAAAATITPEPTPTTTLLSYLTSANPAPSLVRNISFPLRDPHTKHFWWDVRQIRPWTSFNASTILNMPGATSLLSYPVPTSLLPTPMTTQRHPETEAALHSIYANFYLPKLNAALACCSQRPIQLSVPGKGARGGGIYAAAHAHGTPPASECMFVANAAGELSTAAAIFGGKPSARVVGLVKSFDRFNTGMRVEGNIKRVEYLRGLAHLHHAMREHGCRYGFILTEIELVLVRNGSDGTPHFGFLEVACVQLAEIGTGAGAGAGKTVVADGEQDGDGAVAPEDVKLTACLALWGLCMLASDEVLASTGDCLSSSSSSFSSSLGGMPQVVSWRAQIGAPAEGTRRKALPRDSWMPQPQLAEKREAKRARGWVWPEDPVGRKELGKRGVKYGGC